MKKDGRDVEMILTYKLMDGSKYGLSTGTKRGFCTKEFYEFDSVESICMGGRTAYPWVFILKNHC